MSSYGANTNTCSTSLSFAHILSLSSPARIPLYLPLPPVQAASAFASKSSHTIYTYTMRYMKYRWRFSTKLLDGLREIQISMRDGTSFYSPQLTLSAALWNTHRRALKDAATLCPLSFKMGACTGTIGTILDGENKRTLPYNIFALFVVLRSLSWSLLTNDRGFI